MDKHSSLLRKSVILGQKSFTTLGPGRRYADCRPKLRCVNVHTDITRNYVKQLSKVQPKLTHFTDTYVSVPKAQRQGHHDTQHNIKNDTLGITLCRASLC
jgi:hypothetical protein